MGSILGTSLFSSRIQGSIVMRGALPSSKFLRFTLDIHDFDLLYPQIIRKQRSRTVSRFRIEYYCWLALTVDFQVVCSFYSADIKMGYQFVKMRGSVETIWIRERRKDLISKVHLKIWGFISKINHKWRCPLSCSSWLCSQFHACCVKYADWLIIQRKPKTKSECTLFSPLQVVTFWAQNIAYLILKIIK